MASQLLFDYIKKIGYNYVQLQPIADRHKEYDEDGNVTYNWGYDPQNYNAPETSFSTNPDDPAQVIRDLKTMVQAYHDAGNWCHYGMWSITIPSQLLMHLSKQLSLITIIV